jgi:hypothetical protein
VRGRARDDCWTTEVDDEDADENDEAFRPFLMGIAAGMNASAASVETIGDTLISVARCCRP